MGKPSKLLLFLVLNALIFAMASFSMPVLFAEIAADLGLDLVQVGGVWAASNLTGMFIGLLGGAVGDRLGTRLTLACAFFLAVVFSAARAMAHSFEALIITSLLLGIVEPTIPINLNKVTRECFDSTHLGRANALLSMGFGAGLLLGAMLSAAWLSPLLGGWRHVLFLYSGLYVLPGLAWALFNPLKTVQSLRGVTAKIPLMQGLRHVAGLRPLWLIALGALGVRACLFGVYGYLPTYLRTIGWADAAADAALAVFLATGMAVALPAASLSDRLQARRGMLTACALVLALGVGLLGVARHPALIWTGILVAGLTLDPFMAVYNTSVVEIRGVGAPYAGSALGFCGLIRNVGAVIAPPLGNAFAVLHPAYPFLPWAGAALLSLIPFLLLDGTQIGDPAATPTAARTPEN